MSSPFEINLPVPPRGYALRPPGPDDLADVNDLMKEYFGELGLIRDPGGLDGDLDDLTRSYGAGGMLLLTHEGRPVGCLGIRDLGSGEGEIKRMYLQPAHRGRGLGKLLLEGGLATARAAGFSRLMLDTRHDLKAANALYERFGFIDTADYNSNPRAERFMALDL
jgi:GNAT superfamily N-acetyltransferase